MPYYSYVIRSINHGILYKGSTQNLEQRLGYHNQGKVTFTSKYLPWELVLFEPFDTRVEATKREKWYKSGTGRDWIKSQIEQL
jgi:putative endonuclease